MLNLITRQMLSGRMVLPANLILHMAAAPAVIGQTAAERGRAIVEAAYSNDSGYQDMMAQFTMVTRATNGRERTWEMRIMVLEVLGDGDRTIVVFDGPPDLRGTALLTVAHRSRADQWLYLPAVRRAKRIVATNTTESFMGSEFSYEDLGSQVLDDFRYRYIRNAQVGGREAYVVERVPLNPSSGYSTQLVWFDEETYRTLRVEYYDRSDQAIKMMTLSEYHQYVGRFWRPGRMVMVNHLTGAETTLRWRDYEFATGLTERDFDPRNLQHAG